MADDRLARLRKGAVRPQKTVGVQLDGQVREQIEAVEDELDRLDEAPANTDKRLNTKAGGRAELEAELARLRSSAEESTLYVVLEGMQATAYRALIAEHPPRKDGDGKLIDLAGANLETLAEPLVRACVIGYREDNDAAAPVRPMPVEDVDRLLEFVTERQLDVLSSAAFRLCRGDDAVPLPRRRSKTPTSGDE